MNYMMSPSIAWSSWNMTLIGTKLKVFATSTWKPTYSRWRSMVHLMLWIITSQQPLVTTPNWCGEKCVPKASQNWKHKARLVSQYNVFPTTMEQIPHEGLFMVKRRTTLRTHAIHGKMWPCAVWKQCLNN
jgi:hypothetical protein